MQTLRTIGRVIRRIISFAIMMLIGAAICAIGFVNATGIVSWQ